MGGIVGGGGKGGGGDAPKTPDPAKLIELQKNANLDVARQVAALNRVNQVTPFGNLTYSNKGGNWTATQTLDPLTLGSIQNSTRLAGNTYNAADQFLPTVQASLADRFSLSDFNDQRDRTEQALASRLNPYLDRQQSELDNKLANQGVDLGSEAYGTAQNLFGQQKNDAYTQLILQANAEQGRQFQLAQAEQNQPLNQFLALKGQPTINGPSYINAPQTSVANTDVAGIYSNIYNSQLGAYNQNTANQQAGKGSQLGLIGNLGAAAIANPQIFAAASSKEYKNTEGKFERDVLPDIASLDLHRWAYKWDQTPHVGPYAEDWYARFGGDGKSINLIDGLGVLLKAVQELTAKVEKLEARDA